MTWILMITLSIGFYYWGKYKGNQEGFQDGWCAGCGDQSTIEIRLRNKVADLEETLGRVEVGDIKEPKKRGRAKIMK